MAGALRSDAQPLRAGESHRRGHVGGRLRLHHDGWPLVYGKHPRLPCLVVATVTGNEDLSGDTDPQRLDGFAGHIALCTHGTPSTPFGSTVDFLAGLAMSVPSSEPLAKS